MELIADFLLLSATGCACFYCWMLNRRLKKLHGTKDGMAASVVSLSKSVDETKQAIAHSHLAAEASIQKLEPLIATAQQLQADLVASMRAQEMLAAASIAAQKTDPELAAPMVEPQADRGVQEADASPDLSQPNLDALEAVEPTIVEDDDADIELEWSEPEQEAERDVISLQRAES